MRNKIKQLMNKEEGFTLVELLAVIVILGIILAIAIPSIGDIINNASDDADAVETELIEDAARLYFMQNYDEDDKVTPTELHTAGYLDLRQGQLDSLPDDVSFTREQFNLPEVDEDEPED